MRIKFALRQAKGILDEAFSCLSEAKQIHDELEKYYIELYQSNDKSKGYNIARGGNGGKVYVTHPRNMLGKSQTIFQKENQFCCKKGHS